MATRSNIGFASRQQGAALVIGLILLMVLTLLAISGVNTASSELIMAGNMQMRQNAFAAAETGIERAIRDGAFVPLAANEVVTAANGSDSYTYTIASQGGAQLPIWGPANSVDAFATYHFNIQSVGTSVRGAQTGHLQGLMTLAPANPGVFEGGTGTGLGSDDFN